MVVQIHGFSVPIFVLCKELGIDYEYKPVDMPKGEHKTEFWKTNMHPFGQVPVMVDDDGFKLYEAVAICRYLASKYAPGNTLVPASNNFKAYGLFEQAMSVEAFDFHPHCWGVFWEKGYKLRLGLTTDEAAVADHVKKLEEKLDVYDAILEKQKYIAGDEFTFADIAHIMFGLGLELVLGKTVMNDSKRKHVDRWFSDITSRPATLEVKQQWIDYQKTTS